MNSSVLYSILFYFGLVNFVKGQITNYGNIRRTSKSFCPINSECMPLESCTLLANILSNECVLNSNRIGDLGCGHEGSGLVCCPQISEPRTNINSGKMVDGHKCGLTQIIGDNYNGLGAYPWIARIGFRNLLNGELRYPCTGSIISNRIILTAAHCALAKSDNFKLFDVRVGEWNAETEIDCGEEFCSLPVQDLPISHVIVHPGYQRESYTHNIAMIVLRAPINYTVTAQPICLPEIWSVTSNNGILVGWGRTAQQSVAQSFQQSLHLPIINIQACANVYAGVLPITDDHLCAGGQAGNDACSGFGGAPLLVRHGDTHYQVGILSFGSDQCGADGIPSVYTNIKSYIDWIRENTPLVFSNN